MPASRPLILRIAANATGTAGLKAQAEVEAVAEDRDLRTRVAAGDRAERVDERHQHQRVRERDVGEHRPARAGGHDPADPQHEEEGADELRDVRSRALGLHGRQAHRPPGDRASPGSGQESENATANPSTVSRPALRPNFSVASGIIESISITSSAPAAKPSTIALRLSDAVSAIAQPPTVASVQMTATAIHRSRIEPLLRPAACMSVADPIASGRLETKIATSSPTPTPWPEARPIPSTICSGMPSRNAPSASAPPPDDDPGRSITGSRPK